MPNGTTGDCRTTAGGTVNAQVLKAMGKFGVQARTSPSASPVVIGGPNCCTTAWTPFETDRFGKQVHGRATTSDDAVRWLAWTVRPRRPRISPLISGYAALADEVGCVCRVLAMPRGIWKLPCNAAQFGPGMCKKRRLV
jgi:hypothetical protein